MTDHYYADRDFGDEDARLQQDKEFGRRQLSEEPQLPLILSSAGAAVNGRCTMEQRRIAETLR